MLVVDYVTLHGLLCAMLVSRELSEVTLLAMIHHHVCKVETREAHPGWKVQLHTKLDGSTNAF